MNAIELLERQELIQKLRDHGFGTLVDTLLNENRVWTRGNRLNKSSCCRVTGWKAKQLEDALAKCREVLAEDLTID